MRTILNFIRGLVCAAICLAASNFVAAQSDRGSIAGTVLDSSGGIVTNAQVVAKAKESATQYVATTGPTGGYRIQDVKVGIYTITVTAAGFKTDQKTGVEVQVNTVASLDFALTIGDVKDTVTVVADAPAIQSESSDIGTVVSTKQIEELPLGLAATGQSHLRSTESFVFLTPGTVGPGTTDSAGIFESKISGGQNLGTEVILDGASIAHAELGPTFDENAPSVEAISEFKVTTSTIPAEFGRTSGGVESFTTKAGTNSYHGAAFDLLHNDRLNAVPWNNISNGSNVNPRDHQNDFGGSLGGPVRVPKLYNGRDKTFFFFSWEQYRNNQGGTQPSTLPTDAERGGDFSALLGPALTTGGANPQPVLNPCDNTPVLRGQIFDPTTASCPTGFVGGRIAFPGNKITNLSPVAQNVLSFLTVHADPTKGLTNNFIFNSSNPILDTTMSFRIDQNWGNDNKFFFSYSSRDQEQFNGTQALPAPLDTNFFKSRFSHYLRFGWDKTISSSLVNHFNVGFNRLVDPSRADSFTGQDWGKTLGIPNASGVLFPVFTFDANALGIGYQGFSAGNFDVAIPNGLVVADGVSWVKSRHTFRIGFEWRHSQFSRFNNTNTSPNYEFSNFQTAFAPSDAQTGDAFASFLLGLPQKESAHFSSVVPRWNQNYYAAYIQDDFKFRKNLTLNLGFRYDIDTPRHEAHGAQSVLDLNTPNPGAGGTLGALIYGSSATGAQTYYKNFGPRIGFAYAPEKLFGIFNNTVIRGGYGIYHAALFYTDFGDSMSSGGAVNPSFTSIDNFAPVLQGGKGSLDSGFPDFAPPSNAQDPSLLNGSFQGSPSFAAPSSGRAGTIQNWSLEIQHQLAPDLILSVGYVGNHATHLNSNLQQLNAIDPKFLSLGTKLNDSVSSPAGQATLASLGITAPDWFKALYGPSGNDFVGQLLLPFPQYQSGGPGTNGGINTNCCLENLGQSTYNALQAKVERHFRNGLNLLASYTYSKTLTDADSAFAGLTAFGSSDTFLAQNPRDLKTEKALSYQDVPHSFVISYLYELPVGKGKKFLNKGGAVDKVLGGWQLGGVMRYQSGVPFIPFASSAQNTRFGTANTRLSRIPGEPLLAANHASYDPFSSQPSGCDEQADGTFVAQSTNNFFNCGAFLDPNAPSLVAQRGYTFGNLSKVFGDVRSPIYKNEDFSLIKRFTFYEAHVLSFKADFLNLFNRHTLARGDGCVTCGTFGRPGAQFGGFPTAINAPKLVQFTFRYQF
ncbi:MAG TPA: TonB-dependent receptor [Candidatus Acidoferrum sp.]|nr:TonB-dependent receptor [Candidatus Acidoferrum sp.]